MKNIEMSVDKNTLTIKIDLTKTFGLSKSRKTTIIASTEGSVGVPGQGEIKVGVNVYK